MTLRQMIRRGLVIAGLGLWLVPLAGEAQTNPPATQCTTQALAGGTPDVITTAMLPCVPTTTVLILKLIGTNTTTTPTLQPVGTVAQVVVQADGSAMPVGAMVAGSTIILVNNGMNWIKLTGGLGNGSLTSITSVSPIDSSPNPITASGTISHGDSGVVPGVYTNSTIAVNEFGLVTSAANGPAPPPAVSITGTSPIDVSPSPIVGTGVVSHGTSGVAAGSYTNATISVNNLGHVTSAASGPAESITATSPIVVTPSPITGSGVVSLSPRERTSNLTIETLTADDCGITIYYTGGATTVTVPASIVPASPGICYINITTTTAAKVSVNGSAVSPATLRSDNSWTGTTANAWATIGLSLATVNGTPQFVLTGAGS